MMRWAVMICIVMMVLGVAYATAETLTTSDGLTIDMTPTGAVRSLRIDGSELLKAEGFSGLCVTDFASGQSEVVKVKARLDGQAIVMEGPVAELGLWLSLRMSVVGNYVGCSGCITDRTGRDRAVQVAAEFCVNGSGWRWGSHPFMPMQKCEEGREYRNVEGIPWPRAISLYPFSAIISPDEKHSLGLFMRSDMPRIFRTQFAQHKDQGTYSIVFDLGLSQATKKFPSQATFWFGLQKLDPKWGLRSAAAAYYENFPEVYACRAKRHGLWTIFSDKSVFAWWEFGVAFDQGDNPDRASIEKAMVDDDRYGLATLVYTEPQGYWAGYGKQGEKLNLDKAESSYLKGIFDVDVNLDGPQNVNGLLPLVSRREMASAVINSVITDEQGHWQHRFSLDRFGRGKAAWTMLFMNPDPDLPGANRGNVSWRYEVELTDEWGKKLGARLDGVAVDSVQDFSGMNVDNYRREHWAYADVPLTFSYLTKQPVQLHAFTLYEYLRMLRQRCDERQWIMLANGYVPHYVYTTSIFDVLGATENTILLTTDYWAAVLRMTAGRKPISYLDYSLITNNMESNKKDPTKEAARLQRSFDVLLSLAIFPGTGNWWDKEHLDLEKVRGLMRRYIPDFVTLSEAGWEPISGMTCTNDTIRIERYGRSADGVMFFTIHNPTPIAASQVQFTLDAQALAISSMTLPNLRGVMLQPTVTPVSIASNGFRIEQIPAGGTAVVVVGNREGINEFIKRRCGVYVGYLNLLANSSNIKDEGLKTLLTEAMRDDVLNADKATLLSLVSQQLDKLKKQPSSREVATGSFYYQQIQTYGQQID